MAGASGRKRSQETAARKNRGTGQKKNAGNQRAKTASSKSAKNDVKDEDFQQNTSEVAENIIQVGLLAGCIYLFVSVLGFGGAVGNFLSMILFGMFGLLAYIFPFLIFGAYAFYRVNATYSLIHRKMTGLIGMFIFLCPFMHLLFFKYDSAISIFSYFTESYQTHTGGGLIGSLLIGLFGLAFGIVGAIILTMLFLIIAFILLTQRPIFTNLRRRGHTSFIKKKARREYRQLEAARRREAQKQEDLKTKEETQALLSSLPESLKTDKNKYGVRRTGTAADTVKAFRMPSFLKNEDSDAKGDKTAKPLGTENKTEVKEEGFEAYAPTQAPVDSDFSADPLDLDPALIESIRKTRLQNEADNINKKSNVKPTAPVKTLSSSDNMTEIISEDSSDMNEEPEKTAGNESRSKIKEIAHPHSTEEEIRQNVSDIQKEMDKKQDETEIVYRLPSTDLLKEPKEKKGDSAEHLEETARLLQQTFKDFGVNVRVTDVSCGPSVTRYELQPEHGVKVSRIVSLSDDIKLNLAASDIRIEAPIPGKAAVGIEVPNKENNPVLMREMLESKEFQNFRKPLAFAVGKDIGGHCIVTDIAKMPHLLIAGATGSGKSVCINTLIMSILFKSKPEDVKMLMIDPKVVELKIYDGIPHLLIPVVTDVKKASGALNWAVAEMTDRYQKFASFTGVRDIDSYNKKAEEINADPNVKDKIKKLPRILVIVDELADLMMVAPGEVEDAICRLAQLARAAGIHVIIATQRPSVNVVTGLIKANMPSRIALAVASGVDSRTIIDMNGAEKLLGKGDMLFYPQGYQTPLRVQGAFIDDDEISKVVDFLKSQTSQNGKTVYNDEIEKKINEASLRGTLASGGSDSDGRDEYFAEAGRLIIDKDKASIGMLQRMFKIGFNRAARIMDQLCEAGVVGPEEGTKPRTILMSQEQFENMLEQGG